MSQLPDYVASSQPNPKSNRVGWLTTTAASYAGVMLWFAFWQKVPIGGDGVPGGVLSQGLPLAIGALILAAFLCHYLFYVVPGMLGMKTGLPLAVVGTSTFGVKGGYIMPGFLMGALQFGWLGVNAYFAGLLLANIFGHGELSMVHHTISVFWILVATFVGMKGVQYVGAIASFTPILPIIVLVWLLLKTVGGAAAFDPAKMMELESGPGVSLYGSGSLGVLSLVCAYVIGFFATAGAAGVDFGTANKDGKSIQMAGLVGIVLATCFTGIAALVIVAGAQSMLLASPDPEINKLATVYFVPGLFEAILGSKQSANICMLLLVIASFPSACFPTLVAASAFKTTFPKVSPMITCGIGVLAAIVLCVTGLAGSADVVFGTIGASFGPIVGAMVADYLLAGRKWAGPRNGFNMPGWIAWFFGFIVGAAPMLAGVFKYQLPFEIPCPPLSAFVVGFVLYYVCAMIGMQSKVLDMPQRIDDKEEASAVAE